MPASTATLQATSVAGIHKRELESALSSFEKRVLVWLAQRA